MTVAPPALAAGSAPPWTVQNSPNATVPGGELDAMSCSAASACTAVGSTLSTSGLTVTLAERWDGAAWQVQSTPDPSGNTVPAAAPALLGVSCPKSNFCEAVGAYSVGAVGISLADGWNGTAWTSQSFPVPPSSTSAELNGVSCTSATFCEAVGSYRNGAGETLGFAARWNGTTWKLQPAPNPVGATTVRVNGISCVSARFCEAAGNSLNGPFALQWDGRSWQLQNVAGITGVGAVSCVSSTFCEAVGSGGAIWNGSAWSAQTIPTSLALRALSCATATSCEAVGSSTNSQGNALTAAATWDGTSWAVQITPNPSGASFASLNAVSCAAPAVCQAGGDYEVSTSAPNLVALGESWDGNSWQIQPVVRPPAATGNGLTSVACVSQVFCEAVGSHSDDSGLTVTLAEVWNGAGWQIQPTPNPAQAANGFLMSLASVSCSAAAFCEAVGASSAPGGGGAEQWNGTSWVLQAIPGGGLTSVSCTSASFCAATGFDGHVDMWNGSSWSTQAATAGFTSLSSVSCTSPTFCEAVGLGLSGAQAEQWDGTSWTSQVLPTPAGGSSVDPLGVSCSGVDSCEAVGWYFDSNFNQLTLADAWNGTAWAVQPTPNPPATIAGQLQGVSCTSPSFCAATGQYSTSVQSLTVAEVWDGTAWSLRSTPSVAYAGQNVLAGVSCTSNHCTAVGQTDDLGQFPATLVETGG